VVAAGLALGGAAPSAPMSDGGVRSVVAVDAATGRRVAARPLPAAGSFALAYVHSAYHAPAVELFTTTTGGGRFVMYGIASPNEAVLDYYAVAGTRTRVAGWWLLRLDRPQGFDVLPLIGTPVGRRTLVSAAGCVPLYPATGSYDLRIRIAPSRPAGRPVPCTKTPV
jgi:hypothetical protein